MQVGDLVKSSSGFVGVIVDINPLDGRPMVLWNHLAFAYPESTASLEVLNESR